MLFLIAKKMVIKVFPATQLNSLFNENTTFHISLFKWFYPFTLVTSDLEKKMSFSDLPLQNGFDGLKFIGNSCDTCQYTKDIVRTLYTISS